MTYGDRLHEADDDGERLAAIVNGAVTRGGKLIIPSFALGRVEEVLFWLKRLEEEKRIPVLPVYLDSPMAISALQFYSARLNELDADLQPQPPTSSSDLKLRPTGLRHVSAFATARLTTIASPQQSADLIASRQPSIVIASSVMVTGGRVLRHLAATLEPEEHRLFVAPGGGHAAASSLTARRTAARADLPGRRAHRAPDSRRRTPTAKRCGGSPGPRPPRMTYLVHGDPIARRARRPITAEKQWPVHIAAHLSASRFRRSRLTNG